MLHTVHSCSGSRRKLQRTSTQTYRWIASQNRRTLHYIASRPARARLVCPGGTASCDREGAVALALASIQPASRHGGTQMPTTTAPESSLLSTALSKARALARSRLAPCRGTTIVRPFSPGSGPAPHVRNARPQAEQWFGRYERPRRETVLREAPKEHQRSPHAFLLTCQGRRIERMSHDHHHRHRRSITSSSEAAAAAAALYKHASPFVGVSESASRDEP